MVVRTYPALERVLATTGLVRVRSTSGYDAWAVGDEAIVHVLVYDDGHWVLWDDETHEEISTGRSSVHLGVALARIDREEDA